MANPALVQSTKGENASGTTATATLTVTKGNCLVVKGGSFGHFIPNNAVSDSAGNTWTQYDPVDNIDNTKWAGVAYVAIANANGATTVTFAGTTGVSVVFEEWSGVDPVTPVTAHLGTGNDNDGIPGGTNTISENITVAKAGSAVTATTFQSQQNETYSMGTGMTEDAGNTVTTVEVATHVTAYATGLSAGSKTVTINQSAAVGYVIHVLVLQPVQASFALNKTRVSSHDATTITATGNATSWLSYVGTLFSTSGNGTISAINVTSDTSATFTFTGTSAGTPTITDNSTTATQPLTVAVGDQISQYGITWTFGCWPTKGQYASNDWWVQSTSTTLNGSILAGATSITVANAAAIGSFVGQSIGLGSRADGVQEVVTVSAVSGNNLTISATANPHANGVTVYGTVVTSVSPAPSGLLTDGSYRNGNALNPTMARVSGQMVTASWQDGRMVGWDNDAAHQTVTFPLVLQSIDSLVSCESCTTTYDPTLGSNDPEGVGVPSEYSTLGASWTLAVGGSQAPSFLKNQAVLTAEATAPATTSLRPSVYSGSKIRLDTGTFQWASLGSDSTPSGSPSYTDLVRALERPWLDHQINIHATDAAAKQNIDWSYGRDYKRVIYGAMILMDCSSLTLAQKKVLGIQLCQKGADAWHAFTLEADVFLPNGGFRGGRKPHICWANWLANAGWNVASIIDCEENAAHYFGSTQIPVENLWRSWVAQNHPYSYNVLITLNGTYHYEGVRPAGWAALSTPNIGGKVYDKAEGYDELNTLPDVGIVASLWRRGLRSSFGCDPYFAYIDRWVYYTGQAADITEMCNAASVSSSSLSWDNADPIVTATTLTGDVLAGATTFTVTNAAAASITTLNNVTDGFKVGLAGDGTNPGEAVTVTSVSGNTITISPGLAHNHLAATTNVYGKTYMDPANNTRQYGNAQDAFSLNYFLAVRGVYGVPSWSSASPSMNLSGGVFHRRTSSHSETDGVMRGR